ncbi:hypothetical protein NECAME_09980 [Necator americanus]|uniref:Uncharacterized protein n=1 Tax=Necator americanus TaxID=51031 RepID=W2TBA4_NECAM|nr:hypothetical protein NECAME_09980 [Necator americanus]ETN79143.1 hypothetical protein NECAME_09980 [Necator americanus]
MNHRSSRPLGVDGQPIERAYELGCVLKNDATTGGIFSNYVLGTICVDQVPVIDPIVSKD